MSYSKETFTTDPPPPGLTCTVEQSLVMQNGDIIFDRSVQPPLNVIGTLDESNNHMVFDVNFPRAYKTQAQVFFSFRTQPQLTFDDNYINHRGLSYDIRPVWISNTAFRLVIGFTELSKIGKFSLAWMSFGNM